MIEKGRRISTKLDKFRPVFLKTFVIIITILFVLSCIPTMSSNNGKGNGQTPDYKAYTQRALNELKGSLRDFGDKNLDTGLMDWAGKWDGKSLPEVGDIKIKN